MALIRCKECGKEISDSVKKCPNCGYREKKKVSKKKIIVLGIIFTILAIIGIIFTILIYKHNIEEQQKIEQEYHELLISTGSEIYITGIVTQFFCYDIGQVWYKAIFDKFSYGDDYYKYKSSNFSTSISLYKEDNSTQLENLRKTKDELASNMKKLKDIPNSEYKETYDTLVEFYGIFSKLVDSAVSPSGTYKDYIQNYNNYSSDFKETYDKLIILLPEIKDYKE